MEGSILSQGDYVGTELDLFSAATTWKAYWSGEIAPFLRGRVLDVGAGLGATAEILGRHPAVTEWTCLEPDRGFAAALAAKLAEGRLAPHTRIRRGTLAAAAAAGPYDAILYVDVLEHIREDRDELARAAACLAPGGSLVVLAPAHPALFSPFDAAIGHERRYTRASLRAAGPDGLALTRLRYLDSVGLLASLANRALLRQAMPTAGQIAVWDRLMVPLSRRIDPLLFHRAGKSILAVWAR
ncbi:Methyltransferase type 12 [Methylobacterium sp. 4-46]|uniref:class I SAM-dependent methyltransferase n=1 Tax=unclassified Methylobacterium TaxID=2615210 RepID=UPI000152CB93|nr:MULTISPECIES: class I SAM-dependent methyltransferase [Methylobacterium]ACA15493.1 Methyltransferase type 12 [Methylobacterium sp. 4-46]WFT81210.1 class I SAM-dependent methyltransferase [Methylobacterium nodulans]